MYVRGRTCRLWALCVFVLIVLVSSPVWAASRTYTLDADFDDRYFDLIAHHSRDVRAGLLTREMREEIELDGPIEGGLAVRLSIDPALGSLEEE